jgi:hypothetical protein
LRPQVLQLLEPDAALEELTGTDNVRRHFFHVPLLALFGSLQPRDYVAQNRSAIAAAKARAMANLQR